jgi:hypothetical protein
MVEQRRMRSLWLKNTGSEISPGGITEHNQESRPFLLTPTPAGTASAVGDAEDEEVAEEEANDDVWLLLMLADPKRREVKPSFVMRDAVGREPAAVAMAPKAALSATVTAWRTHIDRSMGEVEADAEDSTERADGDASNRCTRAAATCQLRQ